MAYLCVANGMNLLLIMCLTISNLVAALLHALTVVTMATLLQPQLHTHHLILPLALTALPRQLIPTAPRDQPIVSCA